MCAIASEYIESNLLGVWLTCGARLYEWGP